MWVDLFCSRRTELRFFRLLFQLYTHLADIPSYLTETNTVYSCLSFSLGHAAGSVPVGIWMFSFSSINLQGT